MTQRCIICNMPLDLIKHNIIIGDKKMPFCPNHGGLFECHAISFDKDGTVLSKHPSEINKEGYDNRVDISEYDKDFLEKHRNEYYNPTDHSNEPSKMDLYMRKVREYVGSIDLFALEKEEGRNILSEKLIDLFAEIYNSKYAYRDICQGEDEGFIFVPAKINIISTNQEYVGMVTLWLNNGGTIADAFIIHPVKGVVNLGSSDEFRPFDYKILIYVQGVSE